MNQSIKVTGKTHSDFVRNLKSKEMHLRKAGIKFRTQSGIAYTPIVKNGKVIGKKNFSTFINIPDA